MATIEKQQQEDVSSFRVQLAANLSMADDDSFIRLLWALNALQTGRADEASLFLIGYPPDSATDGILGSSAIFPWELETLANELLATQKHSHYRVMDCRRWNKILELVNLLRALENADYGERRNELNILVEMGRIGARQFPWQRGHVGIPQLYRNAFVYGQGECAAYLHDSVGLTSADMTLVGFALLSVFHHDPAIRPARDLHLMQHFEISRDTLHRTLCRIARPLKELRHEAQILRNVDAATAYKPSILRKYPCLLVGPRNREMVAPLPDLIMDRVTNGLFYDVIGGGGRVRDEIGRRFEVYCVSLLSRMLVETRFLPEAKYPTHLGQIATPDILMLDNDGAVSLAIECKASRMSVAARFGELPAEDRGYEEIAKGIMQLWRFFAHCRRQVAHNRLAEDAQGLILTMDEWFAGRSTVIPQIVEQAHELANSSAHEIHLEDRRPVTFCTISELEVVLSTATVASLQDAIRIGSGDRQGWIFSILHQESEFEKTEPKGYPFIGELHALLPWYAKIAELKDDKLRN